MEHHQTAEWQKNTVRLADIRHWSEAKLLPVSQIRNHIS